MRSIDLVRVRSVYQSGPRSALRRPWSPSASGVPTTTAERPSQPGRRQIPARTQATKSIDSSYLRMLHHLGDYADPSCDCVGLSKDPFLRPSSTRTERGAYVAYGSKAEVLGLKVSSALDRTADMVDRSARRECLFHRASISETAGHAGANRPPI